jgi:hypothetical protein
MIRRWPSGNFKPIAVLDVSRETLEAWFGDKLLEGNDVGLGPWEGCMGLLPSGDPIELVYHPDAPSPRGYELRCDSLAESCAVLTQTLHTLGVDQSSVSWAAGLGA